LPDFGKKKMQKANWVVWRIKKTTKHGYAVYIDLKLRVEIRKILEKHYDFL